MIEYLKLLRVLYGDRRGVTALEYALIAGVLATVLVTAFNALGGDLTAAFAKIGAAV